MFFQPPTVKNDCFCFNIASLSLLFFLNNGYFFDRFVVSRRLRFLITSQISLFIYEAANLHNKSPVRAERGLRIRVDETGENSSNLQGE